jgi:type I restriction-modification system DNA methylase subunit
MVKKSEVHAYAYILKQLTEKKSWNKDQIYTQGECLENKEIHKYLGLTKPENVVEVNENLFYVIESKNERSKVDQALKEARKDYAKKINKSNQIKVLLVTGVAGNESEGFIAKSQYLKGGEWETITENNIEVTGLLSKQQVEIILTKNDAAIQEVEITEEEFLKSAETINESLNSNSINKEYRARFISAILLAMSDGKDIDVTQGTSVLIASINIRAQIILKKHNKDTFSNFIKIDEPSNEDNHIKVKKAIVETYQELLGLNIRSAMRSGKDVLGKFYEAFLKYGNGAKEIGIVLTPRHITKFAAEALNIKSNDLVLDPACGTGGFLVSAFDVVRKKTTNSDNFENFRLHGLYGIEEQDPIISLAIVNMIFRGDGKNNMIEGNCFKKWLGVKTDGNISSIEYLTEDKPDRIAPITKVLMNPPFAKPKSEDKEYKFVEHALKQMQEDGLLFSILPTAVMVKQGKYLNWREKSLLKDNTLIAVINFPNDLFYPTAGVETCGVIVKKGTPHPKTQNVLWVKVRNDGFIKRKGKRLPSKKEKNDLDSITPLVKQFAMNPSIKVPNIEEFQKACPIDFNDKNLELLPEVYLDECKPTDTKLKERIDWTIRDTISLMVKSNKIDDFKKEIASKEARLFSKLKPLSKTTLQEVPITDVFIEPIKTGEYHVSSILDPGSIPLVSCVSEDGGFEGLFDIEKNKTLKNAITIACDGMPLTSFFHYYPFVAKDNVLICKSKKQYRFTTLLFITTQINSLRWRFSYGRKCYENKVHKIKIYLPFKGKDIDEDYIENLFKSMESWKTLLKIIT